MNDEPSDFDLKLMPDWLKDAPAKNPYADYETKEFDRPRRDFDRARPSRPGQGPPRGGDRDRKPGGHGERPRDDRRGPPRSQGPSKPGPHRDPPRDSRDGQRSQEFQRPAQPQVEEIPAAVTVEFLPDLNCVASIAKQIKQSNHACPLFGLAKMFLAKPERHRVRIASTDANTPLFQCGENGPLALDRSILEKNAFTLLKERFYSKETTLREPLKGNFTNVARCKLSGKLLGPTNYHAYQPNLRKIFEERFSRRMSFPDYLRQIEISTNPAAVEAWKEEARSVTTFKTLNEPEPVVFESAAEVEPHFRKHYLDQLIQSGVSFEISGEASRSLPDRRLAAAIKRAWEKELGFPGQLMHHLRRMLSETGLHIFKHRKRMQYISAIRPDRFKASPASLSENIALILQTIESSPRCTRLDLANKILHSKQDDPELPRLKSALAADLHWLIHAGHVIEFQDGKLDLPLAPKQLEKEAAEESSAGEPEKAETPAAAVPPEPAPVTPAMAAPQPASVIAAEPLAASEAVSPAMSEPEAEPPSETQPTTGSATVSTETPSEPQPAPAPIAETEPVASEPEPLLPSTEPPSVL